MFDTQNHSATYAVSLTLLAGPTFSWDSSGFLEGNHFSIGIFAVPVWCSCDLALKCRVRLFCAQVHQCVPSARVFEDIGVLSDWFGPAYYQTSLVMIVILHVHMHTRERCALLTPLTESGPLQAVTAVIAVFSTWWKRKPWDWMRAAAPTRPVRCRPNPKSAFPPQLLCNLPSPLSHPQAPATGATPSPLTALLSPVVRCPLGTTCEKIHIKARTLCHRPGSVAPHAEWLALAWMAFCGKHELF